MNAHMAWKLLEGNLANDLCHENWDLYESVFEFLPLGNYNLLSKMYKGPVTKSIKETLKNENASKQERIEMFLRRNDKWQSQFDAVRTVH